jgi:hypothetical protein
MGKRQAHFVLRFFPPFIFSSCKCCCAHFPLFAFLILGGSNMTGTNCDLFTHKSSRSYLNHLVVVSLPLCRLYYEHFVLRGVLCNPEPNRTEPLILFTSLKAFLCTSSPLSLFCVSLTIQPYITISFYSNLSSVCVRIISFR